MRLSSRTERQAAAVNRPRPVAGTALTQPLPVNADIAHHASKLAEDASGKASPARGARWFPPYKRCSLFPPARKSEITAVIKYIAFQTIPALNAAVEAHAPGNKDVVLRWSPARKPAYPPVAVCAQAAKEISKLARSAHVVSLIEQGSEECYRCGEHP